MTWRVIIGWHKTLVLCQLWTKFKLIDKWEIQIEINVYLNPYISRN